MQQLKNFCFEKALIKSRDADFFSQEPSFSPDSASLDLLSHLKRDAASNAPFFQVGNLLFHGIGKENGLIDGDHTSFKASKATTLGLHHVSLFPVTNAQSANDRLADEAAQVIIRSGDQELTPVWQSEGRRWLPTETSEEYRIEDKKITQRTAILPCDNADVLGCEIKFSDFPQDWEIEIKGAVFRESTLEEGEKGIVLGTITKESPHFYYPGGPWKETKPAPPSTAVGTQYAIFTDLQKDVSELSGKEGDTYSFKGRSDGNRLRIFFAAGFTREEVEKAIVSAIENSESFFDLVERPFLRYFSESIPALKCSDKALEKVYAELSVTGYLSTYDVGYEPYHYPFTCPGAKILSSWRMQFYHDSVFSGRAYLWLNDERRCLQDLLQMCTAQYVHCSPRLGEPIPDQIYCMPLVFNMLPQAALEFYRRTGDREALKALYKPLLEFDRAKCRPQPAEGFNPDYEEFPEFTWLFPFHHFDSDGDWLVDSQLPGDDTCRGDEFAEGNKPKSCWDRPDPSLEPADINFYILGNRMAMLEMARIFGEDDVCAELEEAISYQREAIEKWMWNEESSLYADITEKDHIKSHVDDAQNITVPLFGGCITQEKAQKLAAKIFDPEIFGTPMVLPSCPVNYTGLRGKPGFRPTGYWRGLSWGLMHYEAVFGLYRYGFRREAAFILHRFFEAMKRESLPAPENFNPLTQEAVGIPFMGYSAQMLNPFLAFVTGLQMREDDILRFDPIALNPQWDDFLFGPFAYRSNISLTMSWKKDIGYCVKVNDQEFRFARPTSFQLLPDGNGVFSLDESSVQECDNDWLPPVSCVLTNNNGKISAKLTNQRDAECSGKIQVRELVLDKGLRELAIPEFKLSAGEEKTLELWDCGVPSVEDCWILAEFIVDGFAIPFSEGIKCESEDACV